MFAPKLNLIDPEKRKEIFKSSLDIGAYQTAEKYYQEIGMSKLGLYQRLKKYVSSFNSENNEMTTTGYKGKEKFVKKERKLTADELEYLERLSKGTVSTDEMGRFVAVRVFEKMLKNPDDFKFLDFFRVQLLNLKEQESKNKEKWGNELLARMFAGKLPPTECPKCGYKYMETEVVQGELVELEGVDESIRPTESV